MSESSAKFEPSENQRRVAKSAQEANYNVSVTEMCRCAGLDRDAYYVWMKDEAFQAWWEAERKRHFALLIPRVKGAMFAEAISGGKSAVGAARLLLEAEDQQFAPKTRQEVSAKVEAKLSFETMSDDELQRIARASGVTGSQESNAGPVGDGAPSPA